MLNYFTQKAQELMSAFTITDDKEYDINKETPEWKTKIIQFWLELKTALGKYKPFPEPILPFPKFYSSSMKYYWLF